MSVPIILGCCINLIEDFRQLQVYMYFLGSQEKEF